MDKFVSDFHKRYGYELYKKEKSELIDLLISLFYEKEVEKDKITYLKINLEYYKSLYESTEDYKLIKDLR